MRTYRNGSDGSTVPTEITGLQVALQPRSKRQRAELSVAIEGGMTKLVRLTDTQLARIVGVSAQYIHQVRLETVIARARAQRLQLADTPVQLAAE
jgi:hypothetical protein